MSKARDDRTTRVNDVRRDTREYLSRIRLERMTRAESAVKPIESPPLADQRPSLGLLPDPLISKLSEQLVASGLIDPPGQARSSERKPQEPNKPRPAGSRSPDVVRAAPDAAMPNRVNRGFDASQLGMSPLREKQARPRVDQSVAGSAAPRSSTRGSEKLAAFVGLEPLVPPARKATDHGGGPMAAMKAVRLGKSSSASPGSVAEPLPGIETIPTLGPGIVWRLSQAGIHTMADLAQCDAARLREKLGQIGRLVKVEDWIAYARTTVGSPGPDAIPVPENELKQIEHRAVCFGRLGKSGIAAVTDGKSFGGGGHPVAGAVLVRDGWLVALLEGTARQVTEQLGQLIANPAIAEVTLAAWEPVGSRRLAASGVQVASAPDVGGTAVFDPRACSATELVDVVFGALHRRSVA